MSHNHGLLLNRYSIKWLKRILPWKPTQPTSNLDPAYSELLNASDDDQSIDSEKGVTSQIDVAEPRRSINYFFITSSKIFLVLFALWGLYNAGRWSARSIWPRKPVSCSCGGTTVAEAKLRGCVFTPLAIAVSSSQLDEMVLSSSMRYTPQATHQVLITRNTSQ